MRARLRDLHALKGNARAMGLDSIATAAHECESTLVALDGTLTQDDVHTVQRAVRALHSELEDGTNLFARILDMRDALDNAGRLRIAEIEDLVKNLVAGEGSRLGKNVSLRFECASDTTLPGHVAVRVRNALIQMVRNAIAHGIEPSAERSRLGKDPTGAIKVSLAQSERGLTVTCVDDGRGVDFAALEAVARARGLLTDQATVAPQDLLFIPGLSTTEREDALSGRGIGMDLVRDSVDALGGRVLVDSAPGAFTQITLEIPTKVAQPQAPGERDEGIGGR